MKGYKITNNGKCLNQFYEVGKTYQIEGDLIICKNGFHFCKNPDDLFIYYLYRKSITKIFEIEILGKYIDGINKSVTDKLKVIREIPLNEYNDLFNYYQFNNDGSELHYKNSVNNFESWKQYDDRGNEIYYKNSVNNIEQWIKYDDKGNEIYCKNSNGFEYWQEYDDNNKLIHFKNSDGFEKWQKYDNNGKLINYKNSDGVKRWYDNKNNEFKYKFSFILNKILNYFK